MFDRAPQQSELRRVMDACLPGLENRPDFDRDVLRQVRGEVKVKKKLSVSLVLVIVLACIVATALAVAALRDTARLIAQAEQEEGFYAYWPNEKKTAVVSALIEQGYIEGTPELDRIMREALHSDAAGHAADEAFSRFAEQDVTEISFLTIMQAAWGPFDQWTHEERAWYSQLMESVGVESDGKTFFVEPTGSIDEQQAAMIAPREIAADYGVDERVLDDYSYVVSFQIPEFAEHGDDQPYWYVAYSAPADMPEEERLFTDIELFVHPDTGELLEAVDDLRANSANVPTRPRNELYQLIDAYHHRAEEMGFYSFRQWPLALRAAYSQEITPKVKAILESGDRSDLMNGGSLDIAVIVQSTYVYGVPQADAITQDEAFASAKLALEETYGLTADTVEQYQEIDVYYDVSNEDAPLWKFFLNPKSLPVEALKNGYDDPLFDLCYKVALNAQTGDVVHIEVFPFQTLGHALAYDLKWY